MQSTKMSLILLKIINSNFSRLLFLTTKLFLVVIVIHLYVRSVTNVLLKKQIRADRVIHDETKLIYTASFLLTGFMVINLIDLLISY